MAKRSHSILGTRPRSTYLLLFLVLYLIVTVLLFDPRLFTGGDNANYIILAESIASGKGYRDVHLPNEPQHTKYPPGFPLLISLPVLLFGSNIIVLKIFVLLMSLCSIIFLYKIGEMLFKNRIVLFVPLYMSIPLLIVYSNRILSEVPFVFISLGAIYFYMQACQGRKNLFCLAILFAIYAMLVRSIGIALVLSMIISMLIRKQYKYVLMIVGISLVLTVPWQLRNAGIPHEWSYFDELLARDPYQPMLGRADVLDFAVRIGKNTIMYVTKIVPKVIMPVLTSEIPLGIVGIFSIVIAGIGYVSTFRRLFVIAFYCALTLCVLLAWPHAWSSVRLFLPLVPIFVIYYAQGICWLHERLRWKYLAPIIVVIMILLNVYIIGISIQSISAVRREIFRGDMYCGYRPDWYNYFTVLSFIKQEIPKDKIIMARKPEFVYVVSHNKSFRYPFTDDREVVKSAVWQSDYVIVDKFRQLGASTRRYLMPALTETSRENYEIVFQTPEPLFTLLKVLK